MPWLILIEQRAVTVLPSAMTVRLAEGRTAICDFHHGSFPPRRYSRMRRVFAGGAAVRAFVVLVTVLALGPAWIIAELLILRWCGWLTSRDAIPSEPKHRSGNCSGCATETPAAPKLAGGCAIETPTTAEPFAPKPKVREPVNVVGLRDQQPLNILAAARSITTAQNNKTQAVLLCLGSKQL